ncbi:MAG: hypothetical protein L6N96_03920, partial [Candidatus Methylarchaceae archaeon HK02M2]|nr:hypothetical protein [Candidatus Methylarchaceae archaeon HK02M2]
MNRLNEILLNKKALSVLTIISFAVLLLTPINPVLSNPIDNSEVTIFSEDFEGVFPDDNDWAVADLDSFTGNDYWGATDYRAHSGDYSAWCAQIGERTGTVQIFKEDFEGEFGDGINGWSVGDDEPTGPVAYWDKVDSDFGGEGTHSGDYKGYCAGIGYSGTSSSPSYQTYMNAYMSRTVDLTDYSTAYLGFYHKLISTDIGWDYGQVLVDDVEVERFDTVQILSWTYTTINLNAYVGDFHEITFNFYSDDIIFDEGWYIDDIIFRGYVPTPMPNSELHNYDYNMEAIMEMKEIDLSDYTSANLSYYYWMNIETGWDYLYVETSPDGL